MPHFADNLKVTAVIVGGGRGLRFGDPNGKQLASVAGKPVLAWSTDAVAGAGLVNDLVVVCDPARVDEYAEAVLPTLRTDKPVTFVAGGDTRQDSVASGVAEAADADIVVVHDGARPLVNPATVNAAVQFLVDSGTAAGVVVGHPAIDTIKLVDGARIESTPDRDALWVAQTPQIFFRDQLLFALERAEAEGFTGTDDSSLVERAGGEVLMFEGHRHNIKVTVSDDLAVVEQRLITRGEGKPCA